MSSESWIALAGVVVVVIGFLLSLARKIGRVETVVESTHKAVDALRVEFSAATVDTEHRLTKLETKELVHAEHRSRS